MAGNGYKNNKKMNDIKRPNPKILGTGMARDAAEKAKKHQEDLNRIVREIQE